MLSTDVDPFLKFIRKKHLIKRKKHLIKRNQKIDILKELKLALFFVCVTFFTFMVINIMVLCNDQAFEVSTGFFLVILGCGVIIIIAKLLIQFLLNITGSQESENPSNNELQNLHHQ